jgi:hypothetical protein
VGIGGAMSVTAVPGAPVRAPASRPPGPMERIAPWWTGGAAVGTVGAVAAGVTTHKALAAVDASGRTAPTVGRATNVLSVRMAACVLGVAGLALGGHAAVALASEDEAELWAAAGTVGKTGALIIAGGMTAAVGSAAHSGYSMLHATDGSWNPGGIVDNLEARYARAGSRPGPFAGLVLKLLR